MASKMISLSMAALVGLSMAAPWEHHHFDCSQPAPTGRGARGYARYCGSVAVATESGGSVAEVNEAPADTAVVTATESMTSTVVQTVIVSASAAPTIPDTESTVTAEALDTPSAAATTMATSISVAENFRKTHSSDAPAHHSSAPAALSENAGAGLAPAAAAAVAAPVSQAAAPVTAAVAKATAAPVTASTGSSKAASGARRGVSYNSASLVAPFAAGKKVGWAYNWASTSDGLSSAFEYIPMLWGNGAGPSASWVSDATKAIAAGSSALLGFNEPDLNTQSNIDYQTAATSYKTLITNNFAGKARLGSPAVTNGGGSMGLTYLQNFMNACSSCQIDFVAIHWYDVATNIQYFKDHVTQAHTMTGKPVWVTEFGTTGGSAADINTFISTVVPWLEQQSFVERYAYFMASDGILNSGTGLSSAGQTYATV